MCTVDPDWGGSVVGHWPANRKVAGLLSGRGAYLGCMPGPLLGACEGQPIDVSPVY